MVSLGWAGLDPAHNWDEISFAGCLDPKYQFGPGGSAHPNEAMNSINAWHLTGEFGMAVLQRGAVEDFPAIAELNVAAYDEFAQLLGEAAWAAMRGNLTAVADVAGRAEFWVARDGCRLVGSVAYCPAGKADPAIFPLNLAAVLLLAVAPAARGKGVGRRLAEACLARAREDGAVAVGLFTSEAMAAAQRLYEGLGFRRESELPRRHGLRYWRYKVELRGGSTG